MSRYTFENVVALTRNRKPDFAHIAAVLSRATPARTTLFEFYANDSFENKLLDAAGVQATDAVERKLQFFRYAGYDYATLHGSDFKFPAPERRKEKSQSFGSSGILTDRDSFESYPWPEVHEFPFAYLDRAQKVLPPGMKIMVPGPGGLLENLIDLCGYEDLCFMLFEDRALVRAISDAIGERLLQYYTKAMSYACVGILMDNDDWGFNTQTSISTADLREFIFPWHKKLSQLAHDTGKKIVLHSCGQVSAVYEDIICDMQIDGKHSFEDAIEPVESVYAKYHGRLAILGGIDVDFMCSKEPDEIYDRALRLIKLTKGKSYALGTGNSVPDYIPDENYCALLMAALEN